MGMRMCMCIHTASGATAARLLMLAGSEPLIKTTFLNTHYLAPNKGNLLHTDKSVGHSGGLHFVGTHGRSPYVGVE